MTTQTHFVSKSLKNPTEYKFIDCKKDVDIEYCESTCLGEGCKYIYVCEEYRKAKCGG